ncbi:hypothetical protein ACFLVC_05375 [Chloroflexota bacterium]
MGSNPSKRAKLRGIKKCPLLFSHKGAVRSVGEGGEGGGGGDL